jgi:AcrR family transcriptional regulator
LRRQARTKRNGGRTPPEGARTARGLATEAALIVAARRVFERDGFLDARIVDITAEAETASGSFYTYFNSKEEIFQRVVEQLSEEGLHPPSLEYLADAQGDLAKLIERHHREYLEMYQRNAKMMAVVEEVTSISEKFLRWRTEQAQKYVENSVAALRKLQRAGRADKKLDPLLATRALSAMVSRSAFITFVLEEEDRKAVGRLAKTLTRLWVNALGLTQ